MKKYLCWILILLTLLLLPNTIYATDYSQSSFSHDRFLGEVLFGRAIYRTKLQDDRYKTKVEMLQKASYLAIDQMNNNESNRKKGNAALKYLKKARVKGLPRSVDQINPSAEQTQLSGTNHRTYTHMGWKYPYGKDKDIAHPEIRASILQNTVVKVFNFKLKPEHGISGLLGIRKNVKHDDTQCDAFCRLVYYVHVLGDCFEDDNYFQANGSNNGRKIPLGRAHPNESESYDKRIEDTDIIGELIFLMPDLFVNQKNTSNYKEMMGKLNERKTEIRMLYRKPGGIDNDERYQEYHKQTEALMDVLLEYMPKLLKEEPFFQQAFYQ